MWVVFLRKIGQLTVEVVLEGRVTSSLLKDLEIKDQIIFRRSGFAHSPIDLNFLLRQLLMRSDSLYRRWNYYEYPTDYSPHFPMSLIRYCSRVPSDRFSLPPSISRRSEGWYRRLPRTFSAEAAHNSHCPHRSLPPAAAQYGVHSHKLSRPLLFIRHSCKFPIAFDKCEFTPLTDLAYLRTLKSTTSSEMEEAVWLSRFALLSRSVWPGERVVPGTY